MESVKARREPQAPDLVEVHLAGGPRVDAPWDHDRFFECVPATMIDDVRAWMKEALGGLRDAGLLIRHGRPVTPGELQTIASVIRQSLVQELQRRDGDQGRAERSMRSLGLLAIVCTSVFAAWSFEHRFWWAAAFAAVQAAFALTCRSAERGWLRSMKARQDAQWWHFAPARRLDWLGTVRATYQGLWVAIGIGALALVRFDLNGVPPGLQLLMAIPITGASLLGFAAVRYIWSLAAATAGRLLKLPARDPYPTLVVRLLHTAYFLPLHAGMYDENVYSLIRTLEAIAENQFRVPLEEIVTQQQRSGELSAQEVRLLAADGPRRARDALGLLRHVHSQDELRQAVIVAERLVGDHRAVWEAAPHDGEATEASASVKRADDQRKAVLVQTTQGLPHDDYEGPVWRRESRRWIADDLERAATRVEHQLGAAVAARGQVAARISVRASRVAAWLRARESEVLLPASTGMEELHRAIAGGLVSACLGDWTAIECEPCETPQHFSVLQLARRLILPVMLAAAAFGIPVVLDLPSGDATTAVQVSFVGSALLALFAPASALQDATKAMNQALGPDAEPDDTAPGVSTRRS